MSAVEQSAAGTSESARLRKEAQELQAEVLRLQRRLGDVHGSDLNAVRRAYNSLCQHVEALESEARNMVADLQEFETSPIPAELVAQELGVAAAVVFGVSLLHQTIKVLPLKASGAIISKGVWLLGGAFVLARLTGGTLVHVVAMFGRNAGRKRRLLKKLQVVEERINIMVALQQWSEWQGGSPALSEVGTSGSSSGVAVGMPGGVEAVPPPPRQVSPSASSASGELVEMPQVEELEAAEEGVAALGADASRAQATARPGLPGSRRGTAAGPGQQAGGRPAASDDPLMSLRAYVELGKK